MVSNTIERESSTATRPRDQLTPHLAEDLLELLGEAATEILNNDIETNPVYRRLRAMQNRIETARMVVEAGS
jgi:hypothetical protein